MADYRRVCPAVVVFLLIVAASGGAPAASFSLCPDTQIQVHDFFKGSRHEVRVHVIRGAEKGPTVLVVGGIHGDEPAARLAAERYTRVAVTKGSLIVVPRLNRLAVLAGTRRGATGDMNRLFDRPDSKLTAGDKGVVSLAKMLIGVSDYVINLHQGGGFYAPSWVNRDRNPTRWGQAYVIDTPVLEQPSGSRFDLMAFAMSAAERSNSRIQDPLYHFNVRNTGAEKDGRVGKEQQTSMTFFAALRASRAALGIEATKDCPTPRAVALLVTATDSVLQEAGIVLERFPSGAGGAGQPPVLESVRPGPKVAAVDRMRAGALPALAPPGR